jgi:hypothetical protein
MANGGSAVSADKRAEFFRDFIQTVLNLAAGSIVFSVTFLHDILRVGENDPTHLPTAARHSLLVLSGWIALLLSVVASVVYLYVHALSTKYETTYSDSMTFTAGVAILALLAGLVLLVSFGYFNLPV